MTTVRVSKQQLSELLDSLFIHTIIHGRLEVNGGGTTIVDAEQRPTPHGTYALTAGSARWTATYNPHSIEALTIEVSQHANHIRRYNTKESGEASRSEHYITVFHDKPVFRAGRSVGRGTLASYRPQELSNWEIRLNADSPTISKIYDALTTIVGR